MSDVSADRGMDIHRFFEPGSSRGIIIGRHPFGRIRGVVPSGLQHSSLPPFTLIQQIFYY